MRTTKLMAVLMIAGCCACRSGSKSDGRDARDSHDTGTSAGHAAQLEVHVLYREGITLPPTATVTVTMEEVDEKYADSIWSNPSDERWRSKGLVKTIVERTMNARGAPPYAVKLTYDRSGLSPKGRYTVRARIEDTRRLLLASQQYTAAFGKDGSVQAPTTRPIEIVVRSLERADAGQP